MQTTQNEWGIDVHMFQALVALQLSLSGGNAYLKAKGRTKECEGFEPKYKF